MGGVKVAVPMVKIIFNVTSTSSNTNLIYGNSQIAYFSKMFIDGVQQSSVVTRYVFPTTGEHTVEYVLSDPTSIGGQAFRSCPNMKNVYVPDGVITIGGYAFEGGNALQEVRFPNTVTSIGSQAFSNCTSMTIFVCEAIIPPALGSNVFRYATNAIIYVPDASVDTYKTTSGWSSLASRIKSINDLPS